MADNLLSSFLPDDRASFGIFPQMKPKRRLQDPAGAANVPLDVTRGRVAGLAGLLPDVLNFMGRSPMPTEQFGETQYEPAQQLPYGSEYFLQNLPLKPTSRIGEVAGQAGAFVPLNPMPAARAAAAGVKALGPTAGRMAEGYLQRQGLMPNIVPEAPQVPLGSMIEKPQAPVSPLGFYSAAEQAALNIPRKSGTGQSFMNDLMKSPDVKKDELSWIGLDDFLKDKPNVTKQEVQDFISANRVDVQERQLGGKSADQQKIDLQDKRDNLAKSLFTGDETVINGKRVFDDELGYMLVDGNININQLPQAKQAVAQEWVDTYTKLQNFQPEQTFKTRYERYQLPGGENYREILLTTPVQGKSELDVAQIAAGDLRRQTSNLMEQWKSASELNPGDPSVVALYQKVAESRKLRDQAEATAQKLKDQISSQTYRSSHFDEPNILAHMRVNDRVDADGKKMLLIEEIQSDWHQAGREKGYIGSYAKKDVKPYTPERAKAEFGLPNNDLFWYFEVPDNTLQIPKSRFRTQDEAINYVLTEKKVNPEGVPDAPFKDTWHQLALKRALKYAADNGYDRVGLTTGKQQVERYSNQMRQNVDELQFFPIGNQNNILISAKKGGKQTFSGTVADGKFIDGPAEGKTVTEVLGKSMAKQIAEKKDGVIKGDDLTIGGEGMKAYYDEIYPAFFAKQGKKYNAKTGETTIGKKGTIEKSGRSYYQTPDTNATVRYIDISPEMRGGVKKGQPLFTAAPIGGIGVGAGMQDQQQNSLNSFIK